MPAIAIELKGFKELNRRLDALGELEPFMRDLALTAVSEQKQLAPVRTGNLRRTIHVTHVSKSYAETTASAAYAAYVEFGTRPHEIRPRNRRALRWKSGSKYRFATVVQHPGTKAHPYMVPGAKSAIQKVGIQRIISAWNNAA